MEQLLQSGSGRRVYKDERRPYAEWTDKADYNVQNLHRELFYHSTDVIAMTERITIHYPCIGET